MNDRAPILRANLERRRALVVPGCHDALSARIIENAGFAAVQVSGFGLAGSLLGKPGVGLIDMRDILDATGHINRAVRIPVMADIDTGGGNAVNAASITVSLIEMGVAGENKVNPLAAILAAQMMAEWLGEADIARNIREAVAAVVESGAVRTYDMGGRAGTMDMARDVAGSLRLAHTRR